MSQKLINIPGEQLASDAVNDLTCHKHMEDYKQCVSSNRTNYKPCLKYLDQFKYCLIINAKKQ